MPSPTWVDLIGFMASLTVFASFSMNRIVPLRAFALLSNVLFLSYGFIDQIYPVFFLHMILLPINFMKLYRIYRDAPSSTVDADAASQDFVIRRRGSQRLSLEAHPRPAGRFEQVRLHGGRVRRLMREAGLNEPVLSRLRLSSMIVATK